MDIKEEKKAFRKRVKAAVAEISAEEKIERSDKLFKEVAKMEQFVRAERVLMFWSLPDEVQTRNAILEFSKTKTIVLPITVGDDLVLSRFSSESQMNVGNFGILEPSADDTVEPSEIDFAIIPGVAFDAENNRLGRGRGFYDRILESIKSEKVGVCFREQFFQKIPTESFDKKMTAVVAG